MRNHSRQWGACWLSCHLYKLLGLDAFWEESIPASRKGTRWDLILKILVCYRLIEPGSEWRLHRHWFETTAMGDLLGEDCALVEIHKLYRCHDYILVHKEKLLQHLQRQWKDLFNASFDILLYDLTSTYFESDPPESAADKRKFGYSRDKRFDCVQVVIALVVTPEGFPIAYEVMPGNTRDSNTLRDFLKKIEDTAKAVTSCAAILAATTPANSGNSTSNSTRSRKPSRTSKATFPCGRTSTKRKIAWRLTSSSRLSPTVCTSPFAVA
jgi:hypothetical protein